MSNQQSAWACVERGSINLELMLSSGNNPQARLLSQVLPHAPILYGAQPPQLLRPANLVLMNDKEDMGRGPAFFFQQLYDKVIVIRDHDLVGENTRRWVEGNLEDAEAAGLERRYSSDWDESPVTVPTEKPWFCYWNNTAIEGFIYITKDANHSSSARPSAVSASGLAAEDHDLRASSGTTNYVGHAPATSTTAPSLRARRSEGSRFPKAIKLEERRGPRRLEPYCQQMQIMNDGTANPLPNQPVHLHEEEPLQQNLVVGFSGQGVGSGVEKRRYRGDFLGSACKCQWLNE